MLCISYKDRSWKLPKLWKRSGSGGRVASSFSGEIWGINNQTGWALSEAWHLLDTGFPHESTNFKTTHNKYLPSLFWECCLAGRSYFYWIVITITYTLFGVGEFMVGTWLRDGEAERRLGTVGVLFPELDEWMVYHKCQFFFPPYKYCTVLVWYLFKELVNKLRRNFYVSPPPERGGAGVVTIRVEEEE